MNVNSPTFPSWIIYHDQGTKKYWYQAPAGNWVSVGLDALRCVYASKCWQLPLPQAESFPEFLRVTHDENTVDYAGALAGHKEGFLIQGSTRMLVTSGPKFIDPAPGNWTMLQGVLENMFGSNQLPYVYGWIKMSLEMFESQQWMAGQVLVLCGPPGAGKNLFGSLLGTLFGGRTAGKPYAYMAGKTPFNGGFMGCPLLTIDDEVSITGIQARRDFGAHIKEVAVNEDRWLHAKHVEGKQVTVFQRLLITLNDQPERLLILPPIEGDIEDKIMLMRVEAHPMPMPTTSPAQKKAFGDALNAELPAFVDFIHHWTIPPDLVASRYGITHYHHPELLDALAELSPEDRLRDLIDEVIFQSAPSRGNWKGKAKLLERALKSAVSHQIQREANELLPAANSCGRYLGRLVDRYPERFKKLPGRAGSHEWEILPPPPDASGGSTMGSGGPSRAEEIRAMLERAGVVPPSPSSS